MKNYVIFRVMGVETQFPYFEVLTVDPKGLVFRRTSNFLGVQRFSKEEVEAIGEFLIYPIHAIEMSTGEPPAANNEQVQMVLDLLVSFDMPERYVEDEQVQAILDHIEQRN